MRYRLELLGRPGIHWDGRPIRLTSRKGQALLYFLAANCGQAFSRPHLSSLLWSDHSGERARRNFNTMLSRLKDELPVWPIASVGGDLAWDETVGIDVDVREFLRCAAPRRLADGSQSSRDAFRAAVTLWRGPFCEGFECDSDAFDEWVAQERTVWERRMLDALDKLVRLEACEENWSEVLEQCRKALAIDPFHESFHRWTMIAYSRRGERIRAAAHFQEFRRTLAAELGVEPDDATCKLYKSLTAQHDDYAQLGLAARRDLTSPRIGVASESGARVSAGFGPERRGDDRRGAGRRKMLGANALFAPEPVPFVGRKGLVEQVAGDLRARTGRTPFLLITGEAGIGKSRFVEEFLRRPDSCGAGDPERGTPRAGGSSLSVATVVFGRCTPYGENLPYAPLVEGISRVLAHVGRDEVRLPDATWNDLAQVVPELRGTAHPASLRSASHHAGSPVGSMASPLAPASEHASPLYPADSHPTPSHPSDSPYDRIRLIQAIARFLHALPQPVAVIVEDLHWVDSETLTALTYLASSPHLAPSSRGEASEIYIIATSRTRELSPEFAAFASHAEREGRWIHLGLDPLTQDETRDLVSWAWEGAEPGIAMRIHAQTGGIPLYVLETARFMREGGYQGAGGPDDENDGTLPVPPTVARAIAARMAVLGEEPKTLLAAASVFPAGVAYRPLFAAAGLEEEAGLGAFESLVAADFLRHEDGRGVSFTHDIVRRAVLSTLSAPRRTALHRRAFRALEVQGPAEGAAIADQLAYHAGAGELWREAVHWGQEAARAAERLFAYAAACRQLDRTLEALEHLPADAERRKTERRLRAWRFRLRYWFDPQEADARFGADFAGEGAGSDTGGGTFAGGGWDDAPPDVLLARAEPLFMQGEVDQAQPLLERVVAMSAGLDLGLRGFAMGGLGAVHMIRGDLAQAVKLLEEAKPLVESTGRRLPGQSAALALASACALKGDFKRAQECIAEVDESPGDGGHAAKLHGNKAMLAYLQGRWAEAVAESLLGMEGARAVEHHYNEYFSSIWGSAARVQLGEVDRAIACLDESLRLAEKAKTLVLVDYVHSLKAMALLRRGRIAEAAKAANAGMQIASSRGYKLGLALCLEALGHVSAAEGDREAAALRVGEALRRLEAIEARPFLELARRRVPASLNLSFQILDV